MKTYKTRSYTVQAKEMTRFEYNRYRGWTVPEDENPDDKGYMILNRNTSTPNDASEDGHVSWLPEDVFFASYEAVE